MKYLGLDAGSVSVKLVLLDENGRKLRGIYRKHKGHPINVTLDLLKEFVPDEKCGIAVTGSAGRLIGGILGLEPTNEIVSQAYSTGKLYPHINTIIEMGGEDSKLIIMDESGVQDFSMNSVCAAGTGSFLDQQAERLRLSIEEFSDLSLKCKKPPRIAGRCSVFAKSDMIHLQQIATPVHDIVAGLCFAVARNFKGSIARGRLVSEPVSFQGGVAANKGMVRAFREVFGFEDLYVPPDFALMGAMGAAMKARDEGNTHLLNIELIEKHLTSEKFSASGHKPLLSENDDFLQRHIMEEESLSPGKPNDKIRAYMGIDIGSISTNLAVIDEGGNLLAKRYLMTAGRPIEAVRQGLGEIASEVGDIVEIAGVGTTGSGRYMIADFVGADIVKNEITAQATAAAYIDSTVDTIFEIGGQDSKFISLKDGVIVDFEMNKACAAGTGSFLEEQAEKLNISVKKEFAKCAFSSDCPTKLGERCTVFMENSLMANLQKGTDRDNLLAGLAYSIVQNYINRVVAGKHIGKNIFFQGGVAFNKSVVAAFEKYLDLKVTVPPNHDVTGAIGMALIAMRHMLRTGEKHSCFKGFDFSRRPYTQSSFECKGCSNLCEINTVKIEGEEGKLLYGGRCEKYDIKKKDTSQIEDLFQFREKALLGNIKEPTGTRPLIGIPRVFFFNEFMPLWSTLLDELGFDVYASPVTNRQIVDNGLEAVLSESCFPLKVALGHLKHLQAREIDAILLPSFINMNATGGEYASGFACPYTQTLPYVASVAIEGLTTISPRVDLTYGKNHLIKELKRAFSERGYRLGRRRIEKALEKAEQAQEHFYTTLREKGREVLSNVKRKSIVIVGRSYNALEKGMNLQIPEKLATLNVLSIPIDMLPLDKIQLSETWPNMYWRSGQSMLRAARYISDNRNLYPVLIGNFSCGPDSFILKFFSKELRGKPFLHIEIDEHSADAGAITRCEAFLDSIEHRDDAPSGAPAVLHGNNGHSLKGRKIYIPRMADHAFALVAAFEKAGIRAEVLPEPDRETVDIGMKFVSGKECYPCIVTTGDMVKRTMQSDFTPEESVFFMPSGGGPCRFGQYNVFHKHVLESIGLHNVPVYAPNQDDGFYNDLGIVSKDFAMHSWRGIVSIDLLYKCLHETRPYEKEKGVSDALYRDYLNRIQNSLSGMDGSIEDLLVSMREDFESVPKNDEQRPLIGVIGEIFVRTNKFSNEDLIRKIENLGGEAWLAPFDEWIFYVSYMGLRKALRKRQRSVIINTLLKRYYQTKIEHKYGHYFEGFLKTLKEPSTKQILKKANRYVHNSFEGETVLSIGKAMDLAEFGASGVVNAMPFGCMPGTVVAALMRAVTKDFDIPSISMPYDGTESSTMDIQLEAFMDQARSKAKKRR